MARPSTRRDRLPYARAIFFPEPRVSRAKVAVGHMCQWFPRFADRMGLAPVPKKYHVVRTTEFNKDLARILDLLAKPTLLPVRQEFFKLLGRLFELHSKPRAKAHWTYRFLVIHHEHGVVAKEIPEGTRLRERELGRRAYRLCNQGNHLRRARTAIVHLGPCNMFVPSVLQGRARLAQEH